MAFGGGGGGIGNFASDVEVDEFELHTVRYKPESLESIEEKSKFTRKEIQTMYRGFKQECPSGTVNEVTFKEIYAQFFPQGDSSGYAHHVFRSFDQTESGLITFEEFVAGLSVLARGTTEEKLRWAFTLYDINRDGVLSRSEILEVLKSVYEMMGKCVTPFIDDVTAENHADLVFQDSLMLQSLNVLDTRI